MSYSEWSSARLEDVLDAIIDYRGKTPRKTSSGIPLVTAKIVKQGFIQEPNEFIDEADYDKWMVRGLPKSGDVVLTTEAPLGEVAQLSSEKVALAQRIVTLRGKVNVLDNGFLKYFLLSSVGQNRLLERQTGTTVTGIKQSELRKVKIDFPAFQMQKRIAGILSALDEKIELNRQTNATLEAIAQAIFKEWFVHYNYPGATGNLVDSELGMIPAGWRVGRIKDFAKKIQYGFTQKASNEEVGPRFLRITDIQTDNIDWENVPYCEVNETNWSKYRIENYDVVIARTGASTGENTLIINPPKAVFASYLVRVQFESAALALFVGKLLRSSSYFSFIDSIKSGSAQPNANAQQLTDFETVFPPLEIVQLYFQAINQFENLKVENQRQSNTLAQIRDTLLPKLMRGEIEV